MAFWLFSSLLILLTNASENGGFYQCNEDSLEAATPLCIFEASSTAPWTEVKEHVIDRTLDAHKRGLTDIDGRPKNISPKPWVNGDDEGAITTMGPATGTETTTGEEWNYVLIFELVALLRNKMMFDPESLFDQAEWDKYTRVFTDCNVKQVQEINDECHTAYPIDVVYEYMKNPGQSGFSHHYLLQFLEEGAIDVVCLVAEPEIDSRCEEARKNMGLDTDAPIAGQYCDCWMDAYEAIYGEAAVIDVTMNTCTKIEAQPIDNCPDDSGGDGGNTGGPTCCDGSTPAASDSGPPTCDDGSNALAPGTSCPEDDTETTEEPADSDDDGVAHVAVFTLYSILMLAFL